MKLTDVVRLHPKNWREQWRAIVSKRTGLTLQKPGPPPVAERRKPRVGLPGTRLKEILAGPPFWINAIHSGCQCNNRALQMDSWGVDGCRANRDQIVAWLAESAAAKGWPFASIGAAMLVDRAIAIAARDEVGE